MPILGVSSNLFKIQGVRYEFKVDSFPDKFFPNTVQIGFIAQEVEKYYPEVVVTDKDGYKSVDYTRFAPLLLEAIKEQQQLIDAQQAQIDSLKQKNVDSAVKMEQLKAEADVMKADLEKIKAALNIQAFEKQE